MCSKVVLEYNFNSYLPPSVDNPLISVAKSRMILGRHSRKSEQECCCCIADYTSCDNSESFFVFITEYDVLRIYFITRNRLRTAISKEITQTGTQNG